VRSAMSRAAVKTGIPAIVVSGWYAPDAGATQ